MKGSQGSFSSQTDQDNFQQEEHENNYREQLEGIYQFCSKTLKTTINSPETLFQTISVLIKDMKILKKENDKMRENAILNNQEIFSSSNSEIEENNNDSQKMKSKSEKIKVARYKKQMNQMQQFINDQQTKLSDYDTKLQELNLKNKELKNENERYKQEISRFQKVSSRDINNKNENSDNEIVESVVKSFEELIQSQSDRLISLSNQRNKLIDILKRSDQIMSQMENEYQTLQSKNEDTIEALKSTQNQPVQSESIFPSIIEEVHGLGIPYNQISKSEVNHDFIIETITNILNNSQNQSKEEKDENSVSREQYEVVLKQLEGSMKFIQNIANASPLLDKTLNQEPLYVDSVSRTLLLTQCARIGHFIDSNNLFSYSSDESSKLSIFDPKLLQDPEQFLKPILENASEEQMSQSPTRELYALFIGLSEVNKMAMNYMEYYEARIEELKYHDLDNDEREIETLRLWKSDHENKLKMIARETGMLSIPLDDFLDHFLNVYLDTVQENTELQKELQSNREGGSINGGEDIDKAEIEKHLENFELSITREKEKHKKEVSQLKKEVSKYKLHNSQLAEALKNSREASLKRENHYKKSKQALINLKRLVDEVDEKVQNVSEDNAQLNDNISKLNETIKQQNVIIAKDAEKIQKLHDKNDLLTEKLRKSEEKNENTLSGIKDRSEKLNEKYSSTIQNLEAEVQKARRETEIIEDEKQKLLDQKNDLSNQLIKLRVNERSLKIKLDELENLNSLSKKENEQVKSALVRSIKAEATMKIEKSRDEYEKLKNALLQMLHDKFNITFTATSTPVKQKKKREILSNSSTNNSYFNSDGSTSGSLANEDLFDETNLNDFADNLPSIDDIIQKVENCIQISYDSKEKLNELKEVKSILNIPENESLSKGVRKMNDSLKTLMRQNAEYRTNSDNIRIKSAEIDRKMNEQERAIKTAAEWEQWSKSILYRITDGTAAFHGTKDVRFLLEEALLSTIGRRGILTKLDILKAEKKIFISFILDGNVDYLNLSKNNEPQPIMVQRIGSIRPMMVSIMFVRRLQVISHRLPFRLTPFQKKDEYDTFTMSEQ